MRIIWKTGFTLFMFCLILAAVEKKIILELLQHGEIELSSTHKELSLPIIERIYKKMLIGLKFDSIQVAENLMIVNGHHRYLASLLADVKLERLRYPITSAKEVTPWKHVVLVSEDWDTPAKIKMLNRQDADHNGITLEKLTELIS